MKSFNEYSDTAQLSLESYEFGTQLYKEGLHDKALRWLLASTIFTADISSQNSTVYMSATSAVVCKDIQLSLLLLDFLLDSKPDHHAGRQLRICLSAFQEVALRKLFLPSDEFPAVVNDLIEVLKHSNRLDWESFKIGSNMVKPTMLARLILLKLNAQSSPPPHL
jgi:hypothetical protein